MSSAAPVRVRGSKLLFPLLKAGKFETPFPEFEDRGFMDVMRYIVLNRRARPREGAMTPLETHPPSFAQSSRRVHWMGHATCFAQFKGGWNVLTDPVWAERCSPVSFAGPRRYTPVPCALEEVPSPDVVVISHSHYDHLDLAAIRALGAGPLYLVPTAMRPYLEGAGVPAARIHEMHWWDQCAVVRGSEGRATCVPLLSNVQTEGGVESTWHPRPDGQTETYLQVTATPASHWSSRTLFDKNQVLWNSYRIGEIAAEATASGEGGSGESGTVASEGASRVLGEEEDIAETVTARVLAEAWSFYFTGDTGYTTYFETIGETLGPVDVAAIPIGAYEPRDFMRPQHCNPEEAMLIHKHLRAKQSLAIHWGTFPMTVEPSEEQSSRARTAAEAEGLGQAALATIDPGLHVQG